MSRVIVALSGGVDSSVAAYILKERGFGVSAVSFWFYDCDEGPKNQAFIRAEETACILAISHRIVDLRDEFREKVIAPFFEAYRAGITPNPCVLCNPKMKFYYLINEADRMGFEYVSTGHYAVIKEGQLHKALDSKKDQSYALYRLTMGQLKRTLLPLGDYLKEEVRDIARGLSLPTYETPESQEICFMKGKGYYSVMDKTSEGLIIHKESNRRLGTHRGFFHFTIGQRKRLNISGKTAMYVVDIDPQTNTVYVGDKDLAMSSIVKVSRINWLVAKGNCFNANVKIRSNMKEAPAVVKVSDDRDEAVVHFQEPQWAPAPGQSAVFYKGSRVIGGGIIARQ